MNAALRLFFAGALLLGACARRDPETPVFGLEYCRHIDLTDAGTGGAILGAEDLAIDRAGARLFISAYDRRAVERAAGKSDSPVPEGGLYAVSLDAISGEETNLAVRSLVEPPAMPGGLRPHGISYDEAAGVLAFINRAYERENGSWRMTPQLAEVDRSGSVRVAASAPHCSANDLASTSGRLLMTLDHGACGWRAGAEDVFGARHSRVVDDKGATLFGSIGYANGIVAMPAEQVAVAATREKAIYIAGLTDDGAAKRRPIKLTSAPDNLSLSNDGRIVAAVHPSLWRLGLQRRLGIGRSPSRVIEIDPESGAQRLLFDDPKATLVSAATSAISTGGALFVGSVMDEGLVVCRSPVAAK